MAIRILCNNARTKDNQTMKLGHLIKYNKRNVFYEKSYAKCHGETIPRLFSKKIKILWIVKPNVLYNLLLLYTKLRTIETKLETACFYFIYSFFKKAKRYLELVFLPHFWHDFFEKNISLVIFY